MELLEAILINALYLLIVINPVSKLAILCPATPIPAEGKAQDLRQAAVDSTFVAGAILLLSITCGNFILHDIFRLSLASLQISGGIVLAWVGFNALRRGIFFELDISARFADLAIVPLACPLIAGPATITAAITLRSQMPLWQISVAVALALLANLLLMICAAPIGRLLLRYNAIGALIHLTGLIILTMGVQMATDGLTTRFRDHLNAPAATVAPAAPAATPAAPSAPTVPHF